MKKVIFVAGLPGAGKSTISEKVARVTEGIIMDIDEIKRSVVDPTLVAKQIDPPELRWKYYQRAVENALALFDQGASTVIIDEVFHLNSLREKMEDLCLKAGIEVWWVCVLCPYEEVEKRLRSKPRQGHLLSTEEALKINLIFRDIFERFPVDKPNCLSVDNREYVDIPRLVSRLKLARVE